MNHHATFQLMCKACPGMSVDIAMILSAHPVHELPSKRLGFTDKLRIGGYKIYLRTGEYPDGRLGEIFLDTSKDGMMLRALLGCFAMAVSMGLQRGVPLRDFVGNFKGMKFQPSGCVQGNPQIKTAESIIDMIFRDLELQYLETSDDPQDATGGDGVSPEAQGPDWGQDDGPGGVAPDVPDTGGAL